jgi:hypothetical protein
MRVLILMEDRPDGTVEIVTATADGATEITTERGPATGYVLHEVERALLAMGFCKTNEPGGTDDDEHGRD